jgi:hypothetical protein
MTNKDRHWLRDIGRPRLAWALAHRNLVKLDEFTALQERVDRLSRMAREERKMRLVKSDQSAAHRQTKQRGTRKNLKSRRARHGNVARRDLRPTGTDQDPVERVRPPRGEKSIR